MTPCFLFGADVLAKLLQFRDARYSTNALCKPPSYPSPQSTQWGMAHTPPGVAIPADGPDLADCFATTLFVAMSIAVNVMAILIFRYCRQNNGNQLELCHEHNKETARTAGLPVFPVLR